MASPAAVGRAIVQSYEAFLKKNLTTRPVEEVHALALNCVKAVDPSMTLYMFGSTAVYGFHESGSDVDFVALSPSDVQDGRGADPSSEVAKGVQSEFLGRLADVLHRQHITWGVEVVRRTRVPVLRVKGGSGVDFDITANRRNGVRNSALLRAYFEQLPHTRWLSIEVKRWSKLAGVNACHESGCLTSYGFNLMVVYYLLQRGLAKFVSPESCDVARIDPVPPYLPLQLPKGDGQALGAMVMDFLHFYLSEFNADKEVISVTRPGKTFKDDLEWTKRAEDMARIRGERINYRWCIEDPYEHNLNVGRNVTPFKLMILRKHLERARETGLLHLEKAL